MCLDRVFINQAFNTLSNYGVRSSAYRADNSENIRSFFMPRVPSAVATQDARSSDASMNLGLTDPPYADAISYHEITVSGPTWR